MPTEIDKLVEEPIRYGSVLPFNLDKQMVNPATLVAKPVIATTTHLHHVDKVVKNDRILNLRVTRQAQYINMEIDTVAHPGSELVYWLPWGGDAILQTKLGAGGDGVTAPRVFLTDALNGCTVFVERYNGKTAVYHANALGYLNYADYQAYHPQNLPIQNQKIQVMQHDFDLLRKQPGTALEEGSASQYWRNPLIIDPQSHARLAKEAIKTDDRLTARRGFLLPNQNYVRNVQIAGGAEGRVFGVWKNNAWFFYAQAIADLNYERRKGIFKRGWEAVQEQRVLSCTPLA